MQGPSKLDLILGGLKPGIPRRGRRRRVDVSKLYQMRRNPKYFAELPQDLSYLKPYLRPRELDFMEKALETAKVLIPLRKQGGRRSYHKHWRR